MTRRSSRSLPLLVGLAAVTLVTAAAQPWSSAQEAQDAKPVAQPAEDEAALHDSMMVMQQNLKSLRKLMGSPEKKAEAMAAVRAMEGAALTSLQHVPKPKQKLEGSALLKYEVDYKKRMATLYTTILDFQLALDEGDAKKTKNLYRALGGQKKEGHGIYIDGQ